MSTVTVNKGSFDNNGRTRDGYKRIGQSERVVSLIAGTTLAGSAMRSHSLMSAAILLGISAGMIHRGATGKCGFSKGVDKVNKMLNTSCDKISSYRSDEKKDNVSEASDESFPASDAPSFTPVTGEAEGTRTNMNR
jgi:hypothetical protein